MSETEQDRVPWWTCWIDSDGEAHATKWCSESQARNDTNFKDDAVVIHSSVKPTPEEIEEALADV